MHHQPGDSSPHSDSPTQLVESLRDQYDRDWKSGRRPQVEDFLRDVSEPDRTSLFRELLRLEWEQRRQNGEEPTAQEYFLRFPDRKAMIREVAANSETVLRPAGDGVESAALVDSVPVSRGLTAKRSFPPDAIADAQNDGAWPKLPGYEITGVLGRGGMGVVYQARDIQLKRLVAIKMIRAGAQADEEEISRFRIEAEAVARLQHTNIVQVHVVGEHAGLPFVVLEFVDGGSLHKKLGGNPLPSREAARIAETLARAMQAAHDRGIIHRDLKPANILLVSDGTPKISDFGLAKRLEEESGQTQSGHVMGTPSYMSPEQATGDTKTIGPATDIYALGAILYELLTGRPPFKAASPVETLRQVLEQDPVPPRQLNPAIDRDCETIALRCLDKQITRRYATSRDLADELARFLGGEPILARPLSAPTRAWRFCSRRPLVASLAALSVASMLIGTTVSIFFAVLANRRADVAEKRRLDLIDVNAQLTTANATSETRRLAADEAATIAREQSQLALKSLESVIFDIQKKLEDVPGAGDLRLALLRTALARLQEVSDQFASRSAIDRNTKVALDNLGDVFMRIGSESRTGFQPVTPGRRDGLETDPTPDGPLAAARKVYQQAFDISQKLAAADPSDARASRDLSVSYGKIANVSLQAGQVTEALGNYQKRLEIIQKLAAAAPSDAQAQRDLSVSFHSLGLVSQQAGKLDEAMEYYTKYLALCQKLAAADPTNVQVQRDLSVSYAKLGDMSLQAGQVTEALGHFQKLLEICQKLAAAAPSDAQSQRGLMVSFGKLGNVSLQAGQVTEALEHFQKALEVSQKLAAADPTDAQAQRDQSVSYEKLGDVCFKAGQVPEALGHYQKALEIRQKRAAANPSDGQAQFELAVSLQKNGSVQQKEQQYEQAIETYGRGLTVLQSLKEQMRLAPANERWIGILELAIQQCKLAPTALTDWKVLLEQPVDVLPALLDLRGQEFVQAGRVADAIQAVAKLRELGTATKGQLYNAACVYGVCAARIKPAKDELTAEQAAQRQKHIADALATLREAIKAGYKDLAHMQKDADLAPLRDLPEFNALLPKPSN